MDPTDLDINLRKYLSNRKDCLTLNLVRITYLVESNIHYCRIGILYSTYYLA